MIKTPILDPVKILWTQVTHSRYYPVTVMMALFLAQVYSVLMTWGSVYGCTPFNELEILGYLMWPLGTWVIMTAWQLAALKVTEYRVWIHALVYIVSYLIMIPFIYKATYDLLGMAELTLIHFGLAAAMLAQYHILLHNHRKRAGLILWLRCCAILYVDCIVIYVVWAEILWSTSR